MTDSQLTDVLRETLGLFEAGGAPMTTTEVADQLGLGRRSTYERLERLVEQDRLETKKVGGNGRVWWQPATSGRAFTNGRDGDAVDSHLGAIFDRISDSFYALDEALHFRYFNDHAAAYLGLDERAIGSDIRELNLTETFESALYETLDTQEPVAFEDYSPPWDKWFQNVIYPSASGLSVFSRDITVRKRRERELARYETIVETSPIGITIVDSDGRMQFANHRAEEIFGRTKDQINSLSFDDPEWNEVDAAGNPLSGDEMPFPRIMEPGEPLFDHISGVLRPNGERVWISVNGAPVYDDSGAIESVVFSIDDISAQREQQRSLEESERRYRTLAENFPDGAVALYDEDLRYTTAGGELIYDLDVDLEALIGQSILDRYPDDLVDVLEPHFRAALDGQKAEFEVEYRDRHLRAQTLPVTVDETTSDGMVVVQDVTRQKHLENELRESNRRFQQITEHIDEVVWLRPADSFDPLYVNPAFEEIWGRNTDLFHDEPGRFLETVHPDDRERVQEAFDDQLDGAYDETYRVIHPDDGVRWVRDRAFPVENDDGTVYRVVGIVNEITARKEYEHQLVESNERLERFAYAASHDLQEPLRMVTSYLQLLGNRYGDKLDADAEEFLEFAIDGADRMRDMIDALLEYSRIETHGDPFEPVDLDTQLEYVLSDLQISIEEIDAEVTTEQLPTVYGDANQLRQVLQNLLSNAITYSGDEPPRVHISALRQHGEWVISVEDQGIGIDPAEQDRVFTVFDRLHSREAYEGTGIGLALCQRIVERHGGEIWVDSEAGEGATFSVTLPTTDE